MKDFYKVLGISKTASVDEVKSAYKKLARENHPDAGGDQARMQEINEAYDTLKDENKRKQYDLERAMGPGATSNPFAGQPRHSGFSQNDINSIFEDIMNSRHPFRPHFGQGFQQVRRNPNTEVSYTIDLAESFNGKSLKSTIRLQDGIERHLDVNIPPGVEDGATMVFGQQGVQINTDQPPGDIHLIIRVRNHDGWHRQGSDIHGIIEINALDAILGTTKEFKHLDGTTLKVNVPAGAQPGTMLRVPNRGFPGKGQRGHLFITISVSIPKNLNDEQKKLVEQARNAIK